jgi:hypothetical protein
MKETDESLRPLRTELKNVEELLSEHHTKINSVKVRVVSARGVGHSRHDDGVWVWWLRVCIWRRRPLLPTTRASRSLCA